MNPLSSILSILIEVERNGSYRLMCKTVVLWINRFDILSDPLTQSGFQGFSKLNGILGSKDYNRFSSSGSSVSFSFLNTQIFSTHWKWISVQNLYCNENDSTSHHKINPRIGFPNLQKSTSVQWVNGSDLQCWKKNKKKQNKRK